MIANNPDRAMPGSRRRASAGRRLLVRLWSRAAMVAAVPLAVALALLGIEDAFELGSGFLVAAFAVAIGVVVVMLVVGLRDLRAADARTKEALGRAAAAEAIQRARADELARVLGASESLAFTGDGHVDYLGLLEAITPDGATAFLVRVENETEAVVVAAHGPFAASAVGVRRPLPSGGAGASQTAPIASFSASGQVVGMAMPREHMLGVDSEIEAALTVRLIDHDGRSIGWLHMLDHSGEKILEPSFVSLAQLVANQIGVAMENHALLGRVRQQLVEVQRVQAQLVQASKLGAVGELAAAVAHEVNNPLTGILGFAELLMAELPQDDPRHDEAVVIRDEAVRSRTIIRALLEFARPRQPQRIPSNLNDLARSALDLIRYRASESNIRIVAEFGELPCLEIDPDAFRQVLLNLFNNAVDAMPEGGELRVTTLLEQERVGIVVTDVGIGMNADTRRRIFQPFFSTRAAGGGGTGLGLSVSLQIVESHGGTIHVESAPGHGSVFTVWLPVWSPAFEGAVIFPGMDSSGRGPESHSDNESETTKPQNGSRGTESPTTSAGRQREAAA
jgi:two-component system NtrC family sensor kinase